MSSKVHVTTLPNGLCLLFEEIPNANSIAYELSFPGGIFYEDPGLRGLSMMTAELSGRGAGNYDSHAFSDEFDRLGIRHSEHAGQDRYAFRGYCLPGDEERALELLSLQILQTAFPESHIDGIRRLLLHDLDSLMDSPPDRASVAMRKKYFSDPFGRSPYGTVEGIEAISHRAILAEASRCFRPDGALFSAAGDFSSERLHTVLGRLFGGWTGKALPRLSASVVDPGFYIHQQESLAQQYFALCFPAAPLPDPMYFAGRVLSELLTGGMYGRLFLELRERRGLCYNISSRYSAREDIGCFYLYGSTTPERAVQFYDVLMAELKDIPEKCAGQELDRVKVNLETSLVLSEEGCAARCGGNAGDWWVLGRVRTVEEIRSSIQSVNAEMLDKYLENYPFSPVSMATIGAERLSGFQDYSPEARR